MKIKQVKQNKLFTIFTILCSLTTSAEAAQFISAPRIFSTKHQFIAQAFLDDRCPEEYVYLLGYTTNYKIIICGQRGTGNPTHYLGVSRRNDSSILLPVSAYTETRFFARNGGYTYTLDLNAQTLTIGIPGKRSRVERFTVETP